MPVLDVPFLRLRQKLHTVSDLDGYVNDLMLRVFFALFLGVAGLEALYGHVSGNLLRTTMGAVLFFLFFILFLLSRRSQRQTAIVVGALSLLFVYISIRIVFDVAEDNHSSIIESTLVGFVAPLMAVVVLGTAGSLMVAAAFSLLLGGVTIWHEAAFHAIPLLLASLDGLWVVIVSFVTTLVLLFSHVLHRESEQRISFAKQEYERANRTLGMTLGELRKFKLAIENASEPIIITDPRGVVEYVNPSVQAVTGYAPAEVIGKRAGAPWKMPMTDSFYQALWKRIEDEKLPFESELRNRHKNGTIYDAHVLISPVLDEKGEVLHYVGLERDISREKEVERSKSRFVMLASHQLKAPLTALRWYAELLSDARTGDLNETQGKHVQAINRSVVHMVDLVNVLLNVSRLEMKTFKAEPVPIDFSDLARDILQELRILIDRKRLAVATEIAPDAAAYVADGQLIRMVVENLLSNAVKYTPKGGRVTLAIENRKRGESFGGRPLAADALTLAVADSGYGIPDEAKGRIFTSFYRAENVRKLDVEGSGLGLYVVKAVAETCGGAIWFQSVQGKGSTFYVTLPVGAMSTVAAPVAE